MFHPIPEGWGSPQRKGFGVASTSYRPPVFGSWPRAPGSQKSAMGSLRYSRLLCLSREYLYILWPDSAIGIELGKIRRLAQAWLPASRKLAAPGGSGQGRGRSLRGQYARRPDLREAPSVRCAARGCLQGHIDVFELSAWANATKSFRRLHEVITGLAGMLAAQSVGENESLCQLTSSHHEARAVDGPCTFMLHKTSPLGGRAVASF